MTVNDSIWQLYNIPGIPLVLLVDPDGIIRSRDARLYALDKMMLELFGETGTRGLHK
jgi:hypothetical protein